LSKFFAFKNSIAVVGCSIFGFLTFVFGSDLSSIEKFIISVSAENKIGFRCSKSST
jgi:hypothetical protein